MCQKDSEGLLELLAQLELLDVQTSSLLQHQHFLTLCSSLSNGLICSVQLVCLVQTIQFNLHLEYFSFLCCNSFLLAFRKMQSCSPPGLLHWHTAVDVCVDFFLSYMNYKPFYLLSNRFPNLHNAYYFNAALMKFYTTSITILC